MILTVTANSALDKVIYIEEFIPTHDMRSQKMVESVGGKGFDTSVVLASLGIKNLALGIVAGSSGKRLEQLLDGYGIPTDLVWVEGETRVANVIVETLHNRQSHVVTPGYVVSEAAAAEFTRRYSNHLLEADWVIASGSLPEGLPADYYGVLAQLARQAGVNIMVDCSGEALRLAVQGQPAVLKMNRLEFEQAFGIRSSSVKELGLLARAFRLVQGLPALVITCGMDGILAITEKGEFQAASPAQAEVNSAGAGDAVSAAIAWRLSLGEGWCEALRWSAAVSAAVVLTPGTADCNSEDVARILLESKVWAI
ncbi:MAG: hexose kinase [Anaerolineaceae bacterium]|nr:hexose kinase [Anaerolineaceae bacterium]